VQTFAGGAANVIDVIIMVTIVIGAMVVLASRGAGMRTLVFFQG
jgi:hypothetical protein